MWSRPDADPNMPAFPLPVAIDQSDSRHDGLGGITIRDYFAAAAVQSVSCGIIAEKNYGTSPDWLAVTAYEIADSMLLVRDKKSGGA